MRRAHNSQDDDDAQFEDKYNEETMKQDVFWRRDIRKSVLLAEDYRQRLLLSDVETFELPIAIKNEGIKSRRLISDEETMMMPAVSDEEVGLGEEALVATKVGRHAHLAEFDTIPMMILKDIASRQGDAAPIMQSELSGAAGGAVIVGAGNILGSILKFGSNYLLQIGFGATLYGIYSVGFAMVILCSSLCNLGLGDTTIRYTAIYRGKRRIDALNGLLIFCTLIAGIAGILGALCILVFSFVCANIKHEPTLVPLMQLMAPIVPLLCVQTVWFGALQGLKLFKWRVISERIVAPSILLILALLCFFLLSPNIFNIASATVISALTGTCVSAYFLYRVVAPGMRRHARSYEVREWSNFAIFNFLTSVTEVVLESIDTLLLVALAVSSIEIGQYNAAVKISDFIAMPLFSLNTMFAPTIAELYSKGEKEKLRIMYQVVNKWIVTLSLPLFCIAALFARSLLQLSGRSFVDAWPLLVVSAIGSMINAATGSVGYMLLMTGHQRISFSNSLVSVVLNVTLGMLLIPRFGAMGSALGTTATLMIVNFIRLFEVQLLLKICPYSWDTLKPLSAACIGALLIGGCLQLLKNAPLLVHLVLIIVFLLTYISLLIVFKGSSQDAIVLDALRKKFLGWRSAW